jgi:hypothetical protein
MPTCSFATSVRRPRLPGQKNGWVYMTWYQLVSISPIWISLNPSFWMPTERVGSGSAPACGTRSREASTSARACASSGLASRASATSDSSWRSPGTAAPAAAASARAEAGRTAATSSSATVTRRSEAAVRVAALAKVAEVGVCGVREVPAELTMVLAHESTLHATAKSAGRQ